MTAKAKNNDGILQVSIQDDMTIYNSQSLKETLFEYCNSGAQELHLDLSAVAEIDSSGLQLLLLLKAEAKHRRFTLRLLRHSEAVIEVFELLKLGMYFGDPIVFPANWKKS
jgi:anti-anti-sigma factor